MKKILFLISAIALTMTLSSAGEGKCGGMEKAKDMKCQAGKCGSAEGKKMMKKKDKGKCGGEGKATPKEAPKKGKCGQGKCGS